MSNPAPVVLAASTLDTYFSKAPRHRPLELHRPSCTPKYLALYSNFIPAQPGTMFSIMSLTSCSLHFQSGTTTVFLIFSLTFDTRSHPQCHQF